MRFSGVAKEYVASWSVDGTAPALRECRVAVAQAPVVAGGGSGAVARIASGAPVGRVATPAA